jgi:menaquinone-dependent protoporphyrinogen oxidase
MSSKILVTYATRAGSTAEVAAAIRQTLGERGFSVDIKPVKENPALEGYQGVVLGSAIRYGSWQPEAVKYVEQHRDELKQMPNAFFCVHLMNLDDDEASRKARQAYLDSLRKLVTPGSEA